jgi:hypothetical protein
MTVPFRQPRPAHSPSTVDPKDSLGRATRAVCGNSDAAGTIPGIHGTTVDAGIAIAAMCRVLLPSGAKQSIEYCTRQDC